MELFIPDRGPSEALSLMHRLVGLGIAGRNAAYLATVAPPEEAGTPETAAFVRDFEFMVSTPLRPTAAALLGIGEWYRSTHRLDVLQDNAASS